MTAISIDKPRGRAWWKELWVQVLLAMAAGIVLGMANPDLGAKMQPLGDAFIKAIRMLIAPITQTRRVPLAAIGCEGGKQWSSSQLTSSVRRRGK